MPKNWENRLSELRALTAAIRDSHEKDERALIERSDVPSHGQSMPNTPNLNGFRRTSPKSESETTRTRDSYENEKLKERIKMLENDQKQQNKENQILNLENKRLREENKRILDKHKYEKTVWEEELKQALVIALQSIQNRGPQIDLLTDSTQVEKNIIQLFQQQNQV
jgi:ribonuclease HI